MRLDSEAANSWQPLSLRQEEVVHAERSGMINKVVRPALEILGTVRDSLGHIAVGLQALFSLRAEAEGSEAVVPIERRVTWPIEVPELKTRIVENSRDAH